MSCDRCLKVKLDGVDFVPVILCGIQLDLCKECFTDYCKLEEPYIKAVESIEKVRKNIMLDFVYGYRNDNKKTT